MTRTTAIACPPTRNRPSPRSEWTDWRWTTSTTMPIRRPAAPATTSSRRSTRWSGERRATATASIGRTPRAVTPVGRATEIASAVTRNARATARAAAAPMRAPTPRLPMRSRQQPKPAFTRAIAAIEGSFWSRYATAPALAKANATAASHWTNCRSRAGSPATTDWTGASGTFATTDSPGDADGQAGQIERAVSLVVLFPRLCRPVLPSGPRAAEAGDHLTPPAGYRHASGPEADTPPRRIQ